MSSYPYDKPDRPPSSDHTTSCLHRSRPRPKKLTPSGTPSGSGVPEPPRHQHTHTVRSQTHHSGKKGKRKKKKKKGTPRGTPPFAPPLISHSCFRSGSTLHTLRIWAPPRSAPSACSPTKSSTHPPRPPWTVRSIVKYIGFFRESFSHCAGWTESYILFFRMNGLCLPYGSRVSFSRGPVFSHAGHTHQTPYSLGGSQDLPKTVFVPLWGSFLVDGHIICYRGMPGESCPLTRGALGAAKAIMATRPIKLGRGTPLAAN